MFFVFHIGGIVFAATFFDRIKDRKIIMLLLAAGIAFSTIITTVHLSFISLVGFLMGIFIVAIGSFYARFVRPWYRGRVLATAAAMANLYVFYLVYVVGKLEMMVLLCILPLLLIVVADIPEFETVNSKMNHSFISFSLPVFVFYLLGGVMYGVMEPAFREAGIQTHVLFYVVFAAVSGYLYDIFSKKAVAVVGLLALCVSVLMFPENLVMSSHLIQASYAFIDVFATVIWADLSNYGSEARQYGVGLLFITTPILMGYLLSCTGLYGVNTVLVMILLLLSAFLIGVSKEPSVSVEDYLRWVSGGWRK